MKTRILIPTAVLGLTLPFALAQDKTDPGKASDAVKNPPASAPGRAAPPTSAAGDREAGKESDAAKNPGQGEMKRSFSGEITAVSADRKTITINDAKLGSHKLHIGDSTKIEQGDKTGSWSDLKVGAKVEGTCVGGADMAHAETVRIGR